jgi:membrane associated rhomboid family serine protease
MAMARCGAGVALFAAYLAGAGGNLAGLVIYPETHRGLGASGMIMGALGLLGVEGLAGWRTTRSTHLVWRGAAAATLVLVLIGFSQGTDIVAHLGGFFFGAIIGTVLHFFPKWTAPKYANETGVLLLAGSVVLTWWFALKN